VRVDEETEVQIKSRDYWFKVVDFLQQNWALIDEQEDGVIVRFLERFLHRLNRLGIPESPEV
jgi:hypothetical protein